VVQVPAEAGIFLFTTVTRPVLGPTQPPIQWVPGALSLGVKRSGREADHSPPSGAEVKNEWSYVSTPQYVFMEWCSVKAQGQLYLYLHDKNDISAASSTYITFFFLQVILCAMLLLSVLSK
jgi:hypothetical protein